MLEKQDLILNLIQPQTFLFGVQPNLQLILFFLKNKFVKIYMDLYIFEIEQWETNILLDHISGIKETEEKTEVEEKRET